MYISSFMTFKCVNPNDWKFWKLNFFLGAIRLKLTFLLQPHIDIKNRIVCNFGETKIQHGKSFLITCLFIAKLCSATANEITNLHKIIGIYTMIQGGGTILIIKKIVEHMHLFQSKCFISTESWCKKIRIEIISTTGNTFCSGIILKNYFKLYMCRKDLHYAVFPSKMFLCLYTYALCIWSRHFFLRYIKFS